ncbi:hypothetical protein [Lysinibacillus sp. 54212]|uniref:hypothetical protein n=1 Tax=Lysinibacillus sp. 54212 TaxID=3119829 RepID=UPI002FCB92A7
MNTKQLEAEIANLTSMLEDAFKEVAVYNKVGDLRKAADCGMRIQKLSKTLALRKRHLQDRINFNRIINQMSKQGLEEAVKRFEKVTG